MYSLSSRYSRLRHVITAVTVIGMIGGAILIVLGVTRLGAADQTLRAEALWTIVGGAVILCASVLALTAAWLMLKIEAHIARLHGEAHEIRERLDAFEEPLKDVAANTSISDSAKSVAYRARERDALRAAINNEIAREDYESAFHLIEELETRLGYRDDADQFREETRAICTDKFRAKLREAITHVERLLEQHNWPQAEREIQRLEKLMPGEKRVSDLWNEFHRKRETYKQELILTWNRATSESNIEVGLETLRELDQYLERDEAASMANQARELFRERLQLLGTQFQFAVKEKRWRDALATGLQIMEEFPNVRMTKEIAERLPVLRERAGIPADIPISARDPKAPDTKAPDTKAPDPKAHADQATPQPESSQ
jgi:hypothetical protein